MVFGIPVLGKLPILFKVNLDFVPQNFVQDMMDVFLEECVVIYMNLLLLLLIMHLCYQKSQCRDFLPPYKTLIIDEAHNLVSAAYNQLSHEMDQIGYTAFLQSLDPNYRGNQRWNNMLSAVGGLHPDFIALQKAMGEEVAIAIESLKSFFQSYGSAV